MGFQSSTERLVKLFEQELRLSETRAAAETRSARRRVSRELEVQLVEFVEERRDDRTPEQLLVELKTLLARVAPEVPGSERKALLSSVTGRAIDAFFQARRAEPPAE